MQKTLHNPNLNNTQDKSKLLIDPYSKDGKPLDFSFKNITDLLDLKKMEARSGRRKPIENEVVDVVQDDKKIDDDESKKDAEENEEKENEQVKEGEEGENKDKDKKQEKKQQQERKEPEVIRAIPSNIAANIISSYHVPLNQVGNVTKGIGGKTIEEQKNNSQKNQFNIYLVCTSLILSYNKIRSIEKFYQVIDSVMYDCTKLGFIDLSHNYLTQLKYDFSHFPNLKILYLHCNYISNLKEILNIKQPIISLTIHGNPIESIPGFRQFIIGVIPTLKNLDTAHISKKERDQCDYSIKKLLLKIPPPVKNVTLPPEENVANNENNNNNKQN